MGIVRKNFYIEIVVKQKYYLLEKHEKFFGDLAEFFHHLWFNVMY